MYENIKPLKVNIISDIHYYAREMGCEGKAFDKANVTSSNEMYYSKEILEALMQQLAKDDTDIVLVSGDTTCKAEKPSHEGVIGLLRALKAKGKKVYVITATHDFNDNGLTYKYEGDERKQVEGTKREELFDMYREFGPDEAISVHRQSMSYVVQLCDGYRLFALNDDKNLKGASGFSDDCFQWITQQIEDAKANGQFIIPMTHHPMLSPSPFYKIIGGGNIMGEAEKRIDEFTEMGLNYMFTGHTHMQDISYKYTDNNKIFYDITTAGAVGYPATFRQVIFDPAKGQINIDSVDVDCEIGGRKVKDHLEDKFFGMIRRVIAKAGSDIPEFARMATSFSVKEELIYKIGWIIKPFAKLLGKLTIGKLAPLCKKESGLKKADWQDIKDESVVNFIVSLVANLYGGDSPYSPDTAYYKITMGILAIIDSIFAVLGIKIGKILKGAESVQSLVEPLLYNGGICDEKAVLSLYDNLPPKDLTKPNFIKSKKGLGVIIGLVLGVIVCLPVILVALLIGFIVNYIKYHDKF
ncbi:MAG: metallophosphoesterase [Clostridia bacterium]|nr:metallophosphoesterase [Clostridia bacterium]